MRGGGMGTEVLAKCGYRCDLCLAYKPNVEKEDRREELSDGWHRLFGFRIPPEKIVCEGCVSSENPQLIDDGCPVRPCVVARGFENCAHCDEFVCEKHKKRGVRREFLEEDLGKKIDDRDYERFVKPYESEDRLHKIRESLQS